MCGIAGIFRKDGQPADMAALRAMAQALAHRGPDGDGFFVDGPAGLAHTRLAIIDVEGGDQPLFGNGADGPAVLIGNGEIYNYIELLAAEPAGASHRTGSDFEAVFAAGTPGQSGGTETLRGMYALAYLPSGARRLWLARDAFGIKPLYWIETDELVAFASEPRAFFAAGLIEPLLSAPGRDTLLHLNYIPGADTAFQGVRRVLPGVTAEIGPAGNRLADHKPPFRAQPAAPPATLDEAVASFDRIFEESVRIHQRSDVPYGMFLSGGIDSGAVLTMMARLNDDPVTAFTCGFSGTGVADERPAAAALARAVGANHVEVDFSEDDFWSLLPAIAHAFDDPTIDYAVLPTYKLAATARRHVKVVLSGEGGDEIFAGYGRYRKLLRPRLLGGREPGNDSVFNGLGVLRSAETGWAAGIDRLRHEQRARWRDPLQAAQATDIVGWLPADLLLKLDRCLMAHGVEGRTPFLDPEVAHFGFHLPRRFKVHRNRGKRVVREWLARNAPADYVAAVDPFARKKGFTVPVGEWIARRGGAIGEAIARQDSIAEIADPAAVRALFGGLGRDPSGKAGRAAWALLFFALWHRCHIEGVGPGGDAVEFLAG